MDKNLSWASSLGDAYFNQQADVMDAVQVMRRRAQAAGDLKTTEQQTVTTQGSTIEVAPTNPDVVYVPAYDPWLVYGDPIMAWPGWYPYPGIWLAGRTVVGRRLRNRLVRRLWMGLGALGFNWGGGYAMYGGGRYYSRSNTFYNRSSYYRGAASGRSKERAARNERQPRRSWRSQRGGQSRRGRGEMNNRSAATNRASRKSAARIR